MRPRLVMNDVSWMKPTTDHHLKQGVRKVRTVGKVGKGGVKVRGGGVQRAGAEAKKKVRPRGCS